MTRIYRQSLLESLRIAGLRPTIQRITVLQVFERAGDEALSASDVFVRLEQHGLRVTLANAYRVVNELEKCGLLQRLLMHGRKQFYRLQSSKNGAPQIWAMNCRSGERAVLRDAQLQARLLAALADSGLALDGGRIAVEFYCTAAQPAAVSPQETHP